VQWHPEQDEADRRLFAALAAAATRPAGTSASPQQELVRDAAEERA